MLSLTQLLRIPHVDAGFDISPDDSKIACAWNKTGEWQIYELEFPSPLPPLPLGEGNITQLTHGSGGKFNPRYAPDGKHLAYVLDVDGSESYHLIVLDRATQAHTDITPSLTLQPNFCWSPDGQQLAYLSAESGHFCAYIMSVDGTGKQLVLDSGHPAWEVTWSPDGKQLAVCCEMRGQDYGIFVVELETKEITTLCHAEPRSGEASLPHHQRLFAGAQSDNINAHAPQWSPDGKRLSFHSDLHDWFDIGMYDVESKVISWITNDEGDSQHACWSKEGQTLAHISSKGAMNWIEVKSVGQAFSLPLNGGLATRPTDESVGQAFSLTMNGGLATRPTGESVGQAFSLTMNGGLATRPTGKRFQLGQGIHTGSRFTGDGRRLVTTFSSPSQPADLWMLDIESGAAIQLTHSLPEDVAREEFVVPEEIFYKGMDGVDVPALLFRPQHTPAPAVVMIHGGPNWHYSAEWNPVMAHWASRGYAVLCPNYRGSTGYGRAWQNAARFDLGGVDTHDVAAGAQFLLREGLALEKRIAVTGRSHGGYLTMTCLTQFPELWCAGSAVVPFMNWFKTHANSREDVQHWDIENMGDPQENYERWHNASPFFFLDKVRAPVQLICGGHDPRCPAEDSLEARDKLVEIGKEVELLLYADEGHAFLKIGNVLDAELKRMEFIARNIDRYTRK
jgi:dipeptidyl aminopeptidase/acylaminoacyl peptidase